MDARPVIVAVARELRRQRLEAILIGNAAAALHEAVVFVPHYPVSGQFRITRDDDGLKLDFMTTIHGVTSFNSARSRSAEMQIEGETVRVAALADVVETKQKLSNRKNNRAETLAALKLESELNLEDQIRRLQAKPMNERTHFLRKRLEFRVSAI